MSERPDPRRRLVADCSSCAGLCCVVPAFSASADFAIDKPAGQPCPHLRTDHACAIHDRLRPLGFPGCTVYDCFGAGQVVVAHFAGGDWRGSDELRTAMFEAFEVLERLHELLWYLAEALSRPEARPLHAEVEGLRDAVETAASAPARARSGDVVSLQARADPLLGEVSRLVRAGAEGPDLRRRDLGGRDLRSASLVGADLRGAVLLGADLRGADLTDADLLGADLRGADVRGADLATSLFLTRLQVGAARGDGATRLPAVLGPPAHWDSRPPDARG